MSNWNRRCRLFERWCNIVDDDRSLNLIWCLSLQPQSVVCLWFNAVVPAARTMRVRVYYAAWSIVCMTARCNHSHGLMFIISWTYAWRMTTPRRMTSSDDTAPRDVTSSRFVWPCDIKCWLDGLAIYTAAKHNLMPTHKSLWSFTDKIHLLYISQKTSTKRAKISFATSPRQKMVDFSISCSLAPLVHEKFSRVSLQRWENMRTLTSSVPAHVLILQACKFSPSRWTSAKSENVTSPNWAELEWPPAVQRSDVTDSGLLQCSSLTSLTVTSCSTALWRHWQWPLAVQRSDVTESDLLQYNALTSLTVTSCSAAHWRHWQWPLAVQRTDVLIHKKLTDVMAWCCTCTVHSFTC